jgi:hypothetical protein
MAFNNNWQSKQPIVKSASPFRKMTEIREEINTIQMEKNERIQLEILIAIATSLSSISHSLKNDK